MRENKKEYTIITSCPFCGCVNEIAVNEVDFWDWQDGTLIQDAFPYLTANEREAIKTGICADCWDALFSGDEEEEEEEDSDYWEDDVDECGYNPYMGCYDFDC